MNPRRIAFCCLVLLGVWLGLGASAALHHCPDDGLEPGPGKCEFFGHSLQTGASAPRIFDAAEALRDVPAAADSIVPTDDVPGFVALAFALPPTRGPPA